MHPIHSRAAWAMRRVTMPEGAAGGAGRKCGAARDLAFRAGRGGQRPGI